MATIAAVSNFAELFDYAIAGPGTVEPFVADGCAVVTTSEPGEVVLTAAVGEHAVAVPIAVVAAASHRPVAASARPSVHGPVLTAGDRAADAD